jgi:SAM-dependent methyltransferase
VNVGFDLWLDQLHRAAQSAVYRHVDQADAHAMPYPDGRFATVFSNSVLEHIPYVEPVLGEVTRVLAPSGRFVFTVPSDAFREMLHGYVRRMEAGAETGAEAYAQAVDKRLQHYHYHTPETWQELLARAGMTLREAIYYIPEEVECFWDRMNVRFGVGQRGSPWSLLVSPRLRFLGFQPLVRRTVVERLSRRWRPYYLMDVPPGSKGGGLLIVAQRA